jgi:ribosomal protein S27AE
MSLQLETKTKESPTADGAVEYEAVECSRCGYDTPKDNAVMVVMPTYARYKDKTHGASGMRIKHASDAPLAAFCPGCSESVFGERPEPNYQKRLNNWVGKRERRAIFIAIFHFALILLAFIGVMAVGVRL